MKTTNRVWIEIVGLAAAIACILALLIATLGAAAGLAVDGFAQQAAPASSDREFEGMVTCSRCGARHSAAIGKAADVCVRICVHDGAGFALINADSTYLLDGDLVALKKVAGQRARVVGNLEGRTIHVASVSAQS